MPQILPPDESSWSAAGGRTGQALGQSFANAFQQRQERQRLSNALEGLKGQSFNPIDATQRLIGAGASESQLAMLVPMLQQYQNNEVQRQYAEGLKNQPKQGGTTEVTPQKTEAEPTTPVKPELQKLISPELEESQRNLIKPLTEQQLNLRALEIQEQRPGLPFPSYINIAKEENAAAIANQQAQQAEYSSLSTMRNNLNSGIENKSAERVSALGKEGLYDEGSGNYLADLKEKYEDKVAKKEMTVDKAIEEAGKEFKNFADKLINVSTQLSSWEVGKGLESFLKKTAKDFKTEEEKKSLKNTIITKGKVSAQKASQLAYPIEENEELAKIINKSKLPFSILNFKTAEEAQDTLDNATRNKADEILKYIKPSDNILSIAQSLKDKKYDPNVFMNHLRELDNLGYLSLTPQQKQQLYEVSSFVPAWGDSWIKIF